MVEPTLKDKTAKGLFWGGIGNGVQQALALVFGIFLARILDENDYGMVGMLSIFTAMGAVIMDSGFTTALINRKTFHHNDYNSVFWFSLTAGAVMYIILFFCAPLIAAFFDEPELVNLSRVLFLWILLGSAGVAHNAVLLKKLMVKERAKIDITAITLSQIVGIILAFNGFGYWALVYQTVLYALIGNTLRWYYSGWLPSLSFDPKPLKEMFPFSVKLLITGIFTQANLNIITVLLGRYYTKKEVGFYTQGNKWATMGHTLLGNILRGVAQPIFAEVSDNIERQRHIFRKMLRFTAFISFPAMFGLALIAEEFIVITITDKWLPSVPVLQLMCIMGAVNPISSLYSHLVITHGKSNVQLFNTIAMGIVQIIAILCTLPFGFYYMVLAFVIVNVLWVFIWHYFAWKCIKISLIDVAKDILPYLIATLGVMLITYFTTLSIENIYFLLPAKIIIAALLYCLIMWLSKSVIFKEIIHFLLKKK
jgi:O-antigen/teichoic acid export membrane protein